ncbi:MAG TPA: hypothetical protein VH761_09550, partial [Ilumatobacteraceae bacterium]
MIIVLSSAMLLALAGWLTRPRPVGRGTRRGRARSRRWVLVLPAVAIAFASPIPAMCAVATAPIVRRLLRLRRAQRSTRQMMSDYPEALDLIVLSIRAGYLPAQAIIEVVPH